MWDHRNVLYAVPAALTLILAVTLSLLLTLGLWFRARRVQPVTLALIAVRGVAVLALSLWFLQDR
ncbi:hypothetical protein [Streptomyces sp. NPDC020996]|uniref:hypothetical protein n=1 Tax=Streptomyces sp. NPDC020996 TaxID=3154791 RepID=UPI0033CDB161